MSKITREIRFGIVGGNANAGWTKLSHVPAIKALPGLRLAAVATRNEQNARAAAEAFGADRWFSDPYAMIRDDEIDLVTISVKVPAHRDVVMAALEAAKAVYCESPLGRSVAETEGGVQQENLHFSFELRGSEGWLRLTSNSPFGFQAGNVQLTSNVAFIEPEATAVPGGMVKTAINVGEVYAQLARDLHDGAYRTPGFNHALANSRLIASLKRGRTISC